jgi:hypothetical protein
MSRAKASRGGSELFGQQRSATVVEGRSAEISERSVGGDGKDMTRGPHKSLKGGVA